MEQIEQLKAMRDAARARIEAMPDHRLMTSLTALIEDLESAFGARQAAPREEAAPAAGPVEEPAAFQDGSAFEESVEAQSQPEAVEESVVIVETVAEDDAEDIEVLIAPEEIENLIAAEVVSMNGSSNGANGIAESEEEAVNRALDELSIDLADTLGSEPAGYTRS
jgi:hypothetical protein